MFNQLTKIATLIATALVLATLPGCTGLHHSSLNAVDAQLHAAAKSGKPEDIKDLIASGANVNAKDEDGDTALHIAAIDGTPEVIKALIDRGADVNAHNKDGATPSDVAYAAVKHENTEALEQYSGNAILSGNIDSIRPHFRDCRRTGFFYYSQFVGGALSIVLSAVIATKGMGMMAMVSNDLAIYGLAIAGLYPYANAEYKRLTERCDSLVKAYLNEAWERAESKHLEKGESQDKAEALTSTTENAEVTHSKKKDNGQGAGNGEVGILYSYCRKSDRGNKPRARCSANISAGDSYVLLDNSVAQYYNRSGAHYPDPYTKKPVLRDGNMIGLTHSASCHRPRSYSRKKVCTAQTLVAVVAVPTGSADVALRSIHNGKVNLKCYKRDNRLVCNWDGKEYQSDPIYYTSEGKTRSMNLVVPE